MFSLISFLLAQPVVILGNTGHRLGDIGTYSLLTIEHSLWFLCYWSYARFFILERTYRAIFKLTGNYFAFTLLLLFIEVDFFMLADGSLTWFIAIGFILLGQLVGLIESLFLSMIMYYVRGGKVINNPEIWAQKPKS